jgi:DNA-binding CsgD family transcriptional regulator
MYELAGYPGEAAQQLIGAARVALTNAALNVAESYLDKAQALTGALPNAAYGVLIERMETLTLAGRAADAYHSGLAALRSYGAGDARGLLVATARAAFGAGLKADAAQLISRLEQICEATDPDLAVLQAEAGLADRRWRPAMDAGERAAALAKEQGRFDVACEALVAVGLAARRRNTDTAERALWEALSLSEANGLSVWQVRTLAELGMIDRIRSSDPTRFCEARERATAAGMAGMVAAMDMRIGETTAVAEGYVASYPRIADADAQARHLQLTGLYAQTRSHLAACLIHAGDRPLPGREDPASSSEVDRLIEEAIELGKRSTPVPWSRSVLGIRAWMQGDDAAAISLFDEGSSFLLDELHSVPWFGVGALLHVLAGMDPEDAFGPTDLMGHHANWAARGYANAVWILRQGRSPTDWLAEAEHCVEQTPFFRHLLRAAVAETAFQLGVDSAEAWLREADAFCNMTGERALQRRVRQALGAMGAKIPRTPAGSVPPHLARVGITAREMEILRLVNVGMGNADIANHLFISVRTVESHVSSMLQKTGRATRDQLPSASNS